MHDKLTALYDAKHRSSKDSFDRSEDNQLEMYDAYVLGQSSFLEGQFGWSKDNRYTRDGRFAMFYLEKYFKFFVVSPDARDQMRASDHLIRFG